MNVWEAYPSDYRKREVTAIRSAVAAGECVSLVGLSGAGKSNLLGFIAYNAGSHLHDEKCRFVLVDCNRLPETSGNALFRLVRLALGEDEKVDDELQALDDCISRTLSDSGSKLCLLLDRFDLLGLDVRASPLSPSAQTLAGRLRSLRDSHKYDLCLVAATRRPLDSRTELSELFYANSIWLGPLSESDARWNIDRFLTRRRLHWDATIVRSLLALTWGYPSFLKAACEAAASGCLLDPVSLSASPVVGRCLDEFWADQPDEKALQLSGLAGNPLLQTRRPAPSTLPLDSSQLTAKENLLLTYLSLHPRQVCEKDDLIRAVWPEDHIFEHGVRDDSLAQLVRRLREKIESDPSNPRRIQTVPGRGYRFEADA